MHAHLPLRKSPGGAGARHDRPGLVSLLGWPEGSADARQADLDAVGSMAAYLKQKGYAHLGWLLDLQVHHGRSLLVVAVRYYFRREVESDRALFQGLTFAQMEQLDQNQAKGFAE